MKTMNALLKIPAEMRAKIDLLQAALEDKIFICGGSNGKELYSITEGSDIMNLHRIADITVDMGYKYEAFKKGTEAILELNNGKCDVVVIDSATAQKYVSDNPGTVIVEDNDAFGSEEYAIAVAKGNEELLGKINTAIEKMLNDGTISALAVEYSEAE